MGVFVGTCNSPVARVTKLTVGYTKSNKQGKTWLSARKDKAQRWRQTLSRIVLGLQMSRSWQLLLQEVSLQVFVEPFCY